MMTLRQLAIHHEVIPARISWCLADLGEARGRQELYTRQSPKRLKSFREHALIESAVSSNRIEGIEIDRSRIGTLIFGEPLLQDRNEEEVHGYREALKRIHEHGTNRPVAENEKLDNWVIPIELGNELGNERIHLLQDGTECLIDGMPH
jgi:Fic family protein